MKDLEKLIKLIPLELIEMPKLVEECPLQRTVKYLQMEEIVELLSHTETEMVSEIGIETLTEATGQPQYGPWWKIEGEMILNFNVNKVVILYMLNFWIHKRAPVSSVRDPVGRYGPASTRERERERDGPARRGSASGAAASYYGPPASRQGDSGRFAEPLKRGRDRSRERDPYGPGQAGRRSAPLAGGRPGDRDRDRDRDRSRGRDSRDRDRERRPGTDRDRDDAKRRRISPPRQAHPAASTRDRERDRDRDRERERERERDRLRVRDRGRAGRNRSRSASSSSRSSSSSSSSSSASSKSKGKARSSSSSSSDSSRSKSPSKSRSGSPASKASSRRSS